MDFTTLLTIVFSSNNETTILSVLATIFGTLGGLANLPQWLKIFKRKSAKDISIITYTFVFLGAVVWFFYGIEQVSYPLMISNLFGAVNVALVIVGWFIYGRK